MSNLFKLFVSLVLLVGNSTIAISKSNLLDNITQSSTREWGINHDGKLKDIFISSETNNISVLSENRDRFELDFLDENGKLIWKESEQKVWTGIHGVTASKSGNTIVVHALNEMQNTCQSWVYDNNGNLLYSHLDARGWYYPSATGQYLCFQKVNEFMPFVIYNAAGSEVSLNLPPILNSDRLRYRFVSADEVLVYKETITKKLRKAEFILVSIPDMVIKWTHTLSHNLWLIDFNERNCAVTERYIAVQGTAMPGNVLLFDRATGELLWEDKTPLQNYGLYFINNGKQLVALADMVYLYIYDTASGNLLDRKRLVKKGLISDVPKFSFSQNKLCISSNYIEAIDEQQFESSEKRKGMYTGIVNIDAARKKISNVSFTQSIVRFSESNRQADFFLLGEIQSDKNRTQKYKIVSEKME